LRTWRQLLGVAAAALPIACHAADPYPKGVYVLDARAIPTILGQCSRAVPTAGEAAWTSSAADIAAFERALPAALVKARPKENWAAFPEAWDREYVGIVRQGKRFVYGNFLVRDPHIGINRPAIVCDGGPPFFGAEWDVQSRTISHLAFNGSV